MNDGLLLLLKHLLLSKQAPVHTTGCSRHHVMRVEDSDTGRVAANGFSRFYWSVGRSDLSVLRRFTKHTYHVNRYSLRDTRPGVYYCAVLLLLAS